MLISDNDNHPQLSKLDIKKSGHLPPNIFEKTMKTLNNVFPKTFEYSAATISHHIQGNEYGNLIITENRNGIENTIFLDPKKTKILADNYLYLGSKAGETHVLISDDNNATQIDRLNGEETIDLIYTLQGVLNRNGREPGIIDRIPPIQPNQIVPPAKPAILH